MTALRSSESGNLRSMVQNFGKLIQEMVSSFRPDYVIPLETKGAILLEMSLEAIRQNIQSPMRIVYPRAIYYMADEELRSSRFLIVDDVVFTCKSLRDVYLSLVSRGVSENHIRLTALLDFTSGAPGTDYHEDVHRRISFPQGLHMAVTREEALRLIHSRIMEERIPSTYDHLLFIGESIHPWNYEDVLSRAADQNRLLEYGRRGAYLTSSILVDDLFPGRWDFPPKIRLWYRPDQRTLRAAPTATPQVDRKHSWLQHSYEALHTEVQNLFLGGVRSNSDESRQYALYDSDVFTARAQLIPILSTYLSVCPALFRIGRTHLDRYFPGIANQVVAVAEECYTPDRAIEIPPRATAQNAENGPFGFLGAAKLMLAKTREAYERQARNGVPRKDWETQGFTGQEMLDLLQEFTAEQVHAAIDYCFDMNYVAAFLRKTGNWARAMRTTETPPVLHHAEVYAGTVIYSQSSPTPAWMIAKVFPIVANTGGGAFDGILVCRKGPFGDYSNVVMSETADLYWRDVPSDLWETRGEDTEKALVFVRNPNKELTAAGISRDPRIAVYRTPIEAALFLMKQFGRKGAILLNITTGQYGGTEYVTYNLEQILKYALSTQPSAAERLRQHREGAEEKLDLIREIYNREDNLLAKLRRRCSRLGQLAPLAKVEAESIVGQAKIFPEQKLYLVLEDLYQHIMAIVDARDQRDSERMSSGLGKLGISGETLDSRSTNPLTLLLRGTPHLVNWIYALSAQDRGQSLYDTHVYRPSINDGFRYILAYDLAGVRKDHAKNIGTKVTCIERLLNVVAENWIIAMGGRLSKTELNSGDNRYGFFRNLFDCVAASAWIAYHCHQLSFVNKLMPKASPFGMALTGGIVEDHARGNLSGRELDWTGHWLKGKLKPVLDDVAGKAGRQGRGYEESPVHFICHEEYRPQLPPEVCSSGKLYESHGDGVMLEVRPLDYRKYLEIYPTPWAHYDLASRESHGT